jgi:6-phosphogluconate dehydrogenase (decarboxylating)
MQLGMFGLGRMGSNMVRRVMKAGHECDKILSAMRFEFGGHRGQSRGA